MAAYRTWGKRILDMSLVILLIPIWVPVVLLVAALVRLSLGSPILYRQQRPGYEGATFTLVKFRTMREAYDDEGIPLPDDQRLTRLGSFLRTSSLDELPELWNVMRGEMSLVGPRPLLMAYLDHYTPDQARRHDVLPGITGLAQVSGRQDLMFSARLALDVWYVENWSLWIDLKILLRTVGLVISGRGVRPGQTLEEVDDLGLSGNVFSPQSQGNEP